MKFSDLKLGVKQAIGFGLILVIMAGANTFVVQKMAAIKKEIEEVTANRLPRAIAIADLNFNTAALRIQQLQNAFTTDSVLQKQQKSTMIELLNKIEANINEYGKHKTAAEARHFYSTEENRLYTAFDQKWGEYQDLTFTFFRLLDKRQMASAVNLLNGEAQTVFNEFSTQLTELVNVTKQDANAAAQRAELTFRSARRITTTLLILTLLLSAFLAIALSRVIAIPVRHLSKAAKSVAEGDLDVQLNIVSRDEIGRLSQSFNQMTASLREAREKLQEQQRELQAKNQELEEKSQSLTLQNAEIEQKNRDLENALAKLKRTQLQLVQSEKMASLGQLTAGVAHEINNPVNFVASNVNPLRRDIADLLTILAKYEDIAAAPHLHEKFHAVDELKKKLEFSYLQQEIENLLNGIQEGARRTTEIVRGLRNFTRLGEDERKRADINKGIESTLLMLQHQLKNRVEVIKDFGNMPEIMCYPGKLNQVFMNILANASQAIVGQGKIFIKTAFDGEIVTIHIKDTGKGMTEEVKRHIFEPFYTTKGIGEGTGLGLSITYGIIEDHDGNIEVYSEPGKGSEFVITLPAK
jgi:signal transduction histidine kinase